MNNSLTTIYMKDYQPPVFYISHVNLTFELYEHETFVYADITFKRNDEYFPHADRIELHGEQLELIDILLNNQPLNTDDYHINESGLIIDKVPAQFNLKMTTRIHPETNTALSGLYKSNNLFCTQCEAHGFRRITYFLDRPDVMAAYTTKIVADKARYPVLLSNGDCIETGISRDDPQRHYAIWRDPFKKPSYLFALVAGNLECYADTYQTMSDRSIDLKIYVEQGNHDKCAHAMNALKQAMRWDEEMYQREYDLNTYMIVAVSDFNMGAMENKGLNIFNDKYILANEEMATDDDYKHVDAVVGHEYFHNWSGNRITCRDWFQLSLKEGLTVFREQQFMADMHDAVLERIDDVNYLRTYQFSEDASPMAHAVRPHHYVEVNNFYTATVYNKGAEVIRMLHTLLGDKLFRQGMDIYFATNDGHAVTIEDFVKAMEQAAQRDLSQFRLWYEQVGTPVLSIKEEYDTQQARYRLMIKQGYSAEAIVKDKQILPLHIPFSIALMTPQGQLQHEQLLELTETEQQFEFDSLVEKPTPSFLRNFSAPVKLNYDYEDQQLLKLVQFETDGFVRWQSAQQVLTRQILALSQQKILHLDESMLESFAAILMDKTITDALKARLLNLPSLASLCEQIPAPLLIDKLHYAHRLFKKRFATALNAKVKLAYSSIPQEAYHYSGVAAGRRQLKSVLLDLMMCADSNQKEQTSEMIYQVYTQADNMTDRINAMRILSHHDIGQRTAVLQDFLAKAQNEPLLFDRWLEIQACADRDDTLSVVKTLTLHPLFNINNPNRVRALLGSFSMRNMAHFHAENGEGYQLLAGYIVQLNTINPQLAARMMTPFAQWYRFDEKRKQLMHQTLQAIAQTTKLSKDVGEIVEKYLQVLAH